MPTRFSSNSPPRRGSAGFSLLELMVVLVIVGIITAIAFPAYQAHVVKTYRATAKACVMEHAQFLERFYTTRMTYVGAAPNLGCSTNGKLDTRYVIAVSNLNASTYTITATPVGPQRDALCGTLSLDQTGTRTESGSGNVSDCW